MLSKCLEAGIGLVLKAPLLKLTGCRPSSPIMQALQRHWSGRPEILGGAFQEAFEQAMLALAWGVAPEDFWRGTKGVVQSNVTKEFAHDVVTPALQAFCVGRSDEEVIKLRAVASKACQAAAQMKESLFPMGEFEEPKIANLLNEQVNPAALSQLLFARLATVSEMKNAPAVLELLQEQHLLLKAVFQFFRELLLRDHDIRQVLAQLQQDGIRSDLSLISSAQEEAKEVLTGRLGLMETKLQELNLQLKSASEKGEYHRLPEISAHLIEAQEERQHISHHLEQFATHFEVARREWSAFGARLEANQEAFHHWSVSCSSQLDEIRSGLGQLHVYLEKQRQELVDAVTGAVKVLNQDFLVQIEDMLKRHQVEPQLTANSFFSVTNVNDVQRIKAAQEKLQEIPIEDERYSRFANIVGSALASSGSVKKAEQCFQKAAKSARHNGRSKEEALAHYNLFQIHIQQGAHQQALESLTSAVKLDHETYLPFPMDNYTPLKILGAGGMGCAFLCENTFNKDKVVVKIFWSTEAGSHKEVFQEAFMMGHVDKKGEFVPRVHTAGFVNDLKRERPYIVMEYIENSIDGESYLRQHGKMSWSDGLAVGLKVATALQKAHEKKICHLDLKPANLLICQTDSGFDVKIIDFGLARAARSLREDLVNRSRSGMTVMAQQIFGTLDYAPPEQLGRAEYGEPGPKSDLFSFAATMYRLLTNEPPKIINPRKLPHTPHGFYDLLCHCMMADPSQRPDSAAFIAHKLEQLKTPSRHPLIEKTLAQALDDRILEDSEEAMLWNIVQFAGFDQEYMTQMIEEELLATQSRRMSAIWSEEWLLTQEPNRYELEEVWGAMAAMHSQVYSAKGGNQTPWLKPIQHLRSDPAFVCDGSRVWLRAWEPLSEPEASAASEHSSGGDSPPVGRSLEPEKTLQEMAEDGISVGRFVREMGIKHQIWLRILHPDTEKPVADETELQLVRRQPPQDIEIDFNGRHKVGRVSHLFEEKYGLRVEVLDADGEPADPMSRIGGHWLLSSKWLVVMGDSIFFTLKPPSEKGVLSWRDRGTLRLGALGEAIFPEQEDLSITLETSRGAFPAQLVCHKNGFRSLKAMFRAFPELGPGDIVCLTRVDVDVFDVEIFWQNGTPPAEVEDVPRESPEHEEKEELVSNVKDHVEEVLGEAASNAADFDGASFALDDDEEDDEDAEKIEPVDEGAAEPIDAPSSLDAPGPDILGEDALERMTVDQFVKEFAVEYKLWLQILHPDTELPLALDDFIDEYRMHPPKPDELVLHGASLTKNADAQIEDILGLKVQILAPDARPADPNERLARYWLEGGMHLLRMGDSIFFWLKPPSRTGILSWRQKGYLKFGKQGSMLFPEQENIDVTLRTKESEYSAALECRRNQFGKLRELFRDNPELEPGDVVCFTRTSQSEFEVEFFIGSGSDDAETHTDEEEQEEAELAAENKAASQSALSAAPDGENSTSEEAREQRFRQLILESNAALDAGDLETAWSGYNELHFHFPILLETDLDAYRRVAAARFFQEGLEMVDDDPGFALRKFEGANALDKTLLPLEVKQHIESLRERCQKLRQKRFIRLCKKACQIAPTNPEDALDLFQQAKELTPQYWSEQLEKWVVYAQQVIAHRRRSQG